MEDLNQLTDEQLAVQVQQQVRPAFAIIIRRYQKKLMRYATNLTGDSDMASDVVQNAFLKSYQNIQSFNPKRQFSSWLYRIVHNEAINCLKKHAKTITLPEYTEFESATNIEDDYIRTQIIANTHRCLEKLPLRYREPLVLFYLEEKSYQQISDIVHLPSNTIGTRILRAKILLKKICQQSQQ